MTSVAYGIVQVISVDFGIFGMDILKWVFMTMAGFFGLRLSVFKLFSHEIKQALTRIAPAPLIFLFLTMVHGLPALICAFLYMACLYVLKLRHEVWDSLQS